MFKRHVESGKSEQEAKEAIRLYCNSVKTGWNQLKSTILEIIPKNSSPVKETL